MARDTSTGGGADDVTTNYPKRRDDAQLLGVDSEGTPVYYDPVEHLQLWGDTNPKEELAGWAKRKHHPEGTPVSDVVEKVEDAVGWDSLTDFGRDEDDSTRK